MNSVREVGEISHKNMQNCQTMNPYSLATYSVGKFTKHGKLNSHIEKNQSGFSPSSENVF